MRIQIQGANPNADPDLELGQTIESIKVEF
jgi:hypothetical protein